MKVTGMSIGVLLCAGALIGCNSTKLAQRDQKAKVGKEEGVKKPAVTQTKKNDRTSDSIVDAEPTEEPRRGILAVTDEEALHDILSGDEQTAKVCARNANKTNRIVTTFCNDGIRPTNLIELQNALGFTFTNPSADRDSNGANGNPAFAFQGHSSSLVGRFTSSINPRVVMMTPDNLNNNNPNPGFVAMGFLRGEQFAEIIVNNGDTDGDGIQDLDIFLVGFKQACNAKPDGCSPGDLLTPAIESNWTEFTLYDDEDLKNTIVDCRQCHQPEGLNSPKIIRMQELRNPWTHWFRDNTDGVALIDDYYAAHGQDEVYAGVPGVAIRASDPQKLENLVRGNGFRELQVREVEFPTADIRAEINGNNQAQPEDNTIPGESPTWEALYLNSMDGVAADGRTVIPVPYHDVKVTEPALLAEWTRQYQDFQAGLVTIDEFKDHREVLRTDPRQRANMGFAIRPEATAIQALNLSCRQCHNSKLDQSLSRAKFNVDLAAMGANAVAEIDIAIERLRLGYTPDRLKQEKILFVDKDNEYVDLHKGEHLLTMPPRRFKDLTNEQIDMIITYLRDEQQKLKAQFNQ